MELTWTKIDKAGERLSKGTWETGEQCLESELIIDEYRKLHIQSLGEVPNINILKNMCKCLIFTHVV